MNILLSTSKVIKKITRKFKEDKTCSPLLPSFNGLKRTGSPLIVSSLTHITPVNTSEKITAAVASLSNNQVMYYPCPTKKSCIHHCIHKLIQAYKRNPSHQYSFGNTSNERRDPSFFDLDKLGRPLNKALKKQQFFVSTEKLWKRVLKYLPLFNWA